MADPEQLLALEAAGPQLAAAPAGPVVPGAPAGPAAPPPRPNRFLAFMGKQWKKLVTPTPHKPIEYVDYRLAVIVNHELDGAATGTAHESRVGESAALVVDHLMTGSGAETPIGHLTGATMEYGWRTWNATRGRDVQTPPPAPPAAAPAPNVRVLPPIEPPAPAPPPAPAEKPKTKPKQRAKRGAR